MKIPSGQSEVVNRKTDNDTAKINIGKQIMKKTKQGVKSGTPKVAVVVLFLTKIR